MEVNNRMDYRLNDYLEPDEKGLVIATDNPRFDRFGTKQQNGRIFLWMIGRPRKVFGQDDRLSELVFHNGDLLALTSDDNVFATLGLKNLRTRELIVPGYAKKPLSHDGKLYVVKEEYTSEKSYFDEEKGQYVTRRGYIDSIFYQVSEDKKLEEIAKRRARVEAVVGIPDGIVASMMPEPRGSGDNFIENITKGEVIYSEPTRVDGYDLGQITGLCSAGERLVFDRYPHGIFDLNGKQVARFPLIEWLFKKEAEILKEIFGNRPLRIEDVPSYRAEQLSREIGKLEKIAADKLGYSYEKAMSGESDSWRHKWKDAKRLRWDPECSYRRIALRRFIEYRSKIWYSSYFNNHLILASYQNLYSIPVNEESEGIIIDPFKNKLWTFEDNIVGMAVVEGEELRKLKGQANVRMGRRKANSVHHNVFLRAA